MKTCWYSCSSRTTGCGASSRTGGTIRTGFRYTWMGHSIGRWDGDTLAVDTININPESWWLDNLAHPKTDQLHITERFRMPNDDTVEIAFTFDDPGAYTRTWNGNKVFVRAPEGYEVLEDVTCEEFLDLNKKGRY